MLRALTLISCLLAAAPAIGAPVAANPQTHLDTPGKTATLEQSGTQITASYAWHDRLMDLTVQITDPDGDTMRTRVGMRDSQRHTLLLPALEEWAASTRIDFRRIGSRIEMKIDDAEVATYLATRQTPRHF